MVRILVVDDEPIIADGLYEELQLCSELDADVYRTYSGKGALELLARHRIDIVVTDIRMPGMDGMALLEKIRASWPECKVIFLTGHREFDYAYKAIQYKGLQYVLKTEGYKRVISAIQSAISEIENDLTLHDQMDNLSKRMDVASMFLQKEFLKKLLDRLPENQPDRFPVPPQDSMPGSVLARADFQLYGIDLDIDQPVLMIVGRLAPSLQSFGHSDFMHCCTTIKLVSEQYLSPHMHLACFPDEQSDMIILAQPKKTFEQAQKADPAVSWHHVALFVNETLELMQNAIRTNLGCTISFGMGSAADFRKDIPQTYETVKRRMDVRIGAGEEMLMTENTSEPEEIPAPLETESHWKMKSKTDILSMLLDRGDRASFDKTFDSATAILLNTKDKNNHAASEAYLSIALMILTYLNRWQLHEKVSQLVDPAPLVNADLLSTWQEAVQYLRRMSSLLFNIQHMDENKRATDILARLRTYVDNHLGEDLSLFRLSELMYFNPSYLSRLFKQLSGENLTDYIQRQRIDKAKEMLEKNDLRVNDIASAVGFGSATNFGRFFKKATGITPLEYRDRLSADKAGGGKAGGDR